MTQLFDIFPIHGQFRFLTLHQSLLELRNFHSDQLVAGCHVSHQIAPVATQLLPGRKSLRVQLERERTEIDLKAETT